MIELFCDATPKSIAYVIYRGTLAESFSQLLVEKHTVNEAEYSALIAGLRHCLAKGEEDISIFSDSELMVKQILGQYKVRKNLKPFWNEAMTLLSQLQQFSIEWISGKDNPADLPSRLIVGKVK